MSSLVYEANARMKDPIYGCVGTISSLQHQIEFLQKQLAIAQAELVHMNMQQFSSMSGGATAANSPENMSSSRHLQSEVYSEFEIYDIMQQR